MRVGIIGGGQLGRMLALAAHPLGIGCVTLDPAKDSPASQVAPAIVGAYDDEDALLELAGEANVVTYEFENVPVEAARFLQQRVDVFPLPESLEAAQDRLAEKELFTTVGLPVPPYAPVDDLASLERAIADVGLPAVLKTRRLGYDGKGQAVLRAPALAEDAWRAIGEVAAICEAHVDFDRELSIIGVRSRDGEVRCYPLVENVHRDGILRVSRAPAAGVDAGLQARAEGHLRAVAGRLRHVGALAIELFQVGEELLGNEMAPRVHNSGHWTIEGAVTSQFENHLRAVCGLPLGPTAARAPSAMVNLIGGWPEPAEILAIPGAHLHLYGKQPRPGRKVGHVTLLAHDREALEANIDRVQALTGDAPNLG